MYCFQMIFLTLFLLSNKQSDACSEIIIRAKDDSIVVGRSMDVNLLLSPGLYIEPIGTRHYASVPSSCTTGSRVNWKNRYHTIVIRPMKEKMNQVSLDGINSEGLSMSGLYLPGYTAYEKVTDCSSAIPQTELIAYVLGNFRDISEVRHAFKTNSFPTVWGDKLYGVMQPAHWAITDKTGDAVVLEYTSGKRMVFNNTVRVMTNSPSYDWHMENIKHYVHISKNHPERKYFDGQNKEHSIPKLRGFALSGLPGDYTSPSRFIKAAMMAHYAEVPETREEAIVQAFHILGSVEVNKNVVQGRMGFQFYTFWQIAKDLHDNCIYYRSHQYLSLRKICLPRNGPIRKAFYKLIDDFQKGVEDMSLKMNRLTQ